MKYVFLALIVLVLPYTVHGMSTDTFLEKLAKCESGNRWNIRIVDSNGYYSYGGLQFQLGTFQHFGKLYGILPDEFTDNEARLLIYNESVQKAIAGRMYERGIADDHWVHCYKKVIPIK